MKRQVVSLSEWRDTRTDQCPARLKHDRVKRRRRSADLVKIKAVPAVHGGGWIPSGTRSALLVALLFLTFGLWLWMVFKLDAIIQAGRDHGTEGKQPLAPGHSIGRQPIGSGLSIHLRSQKHDDSGYRADAISGLANRGTKQV
jgi:hypothetical protein